MITFITWLTWPKHIAFKGLTYDNLIKLQNYIKGPDYALTVFLDLAIVLIIAGIVFYKYVTKETSSKEQP